MAETPNIEKLDHWTLVSSDVARTKRFYMEMLGAQPPERSGGPACVNLAGTVIDFFPADERQQPMPGSGGQHPLPGDHGQSAGVVGLDQGGDAGVGFGVGVRVGVQLPPGDQECLRNRRSFIVFL